MSWLPGSKANLLTNQREIVHVSQCHHQSTCSLSSHFLVLPLFIFNLTKTQHQSLSYECHRCICMLMCFVFLPCHVLEALTSKKKSKGRKKPKPSQSQGRTFIHHQCNLMFFLFCFPLQFCISYFRSRPIFLSMQLNTVCVYCYSSWRGQRWHV